MKRSPSSIVISVKGAGRARVERWSDASDACRCHQDGCYYCNCNDMTKVDRLWCPPFDVVSNLIGHPSPPEAAAISRADAAGLMTRGVHAVLKDRGFNDGVLRDRVAGDRGSSEELMKLCKERLAPYQYPRRVHVVSELANTATGKAQRFRLSRIGRVR